jgi:putative toxin-antitoxin system antitoxin component (TIGR02293 family)
LEKCQEMGFKKQPNQSNEPENLSGEPLLLAEPMIAYLPSKGPGSYLGISGGSLYGANLKERQLKLIRGGLTRGSLDVLMEKTGLTIYELADILEITDRTLRRYETHEVLNKRLSERALEIAQLYSRGEEVFGDNSSFSQWMQTEIPSLGHRVPKSFLDTSLGIQMLMDELGRIEHGVFA